MNHSSSSKSKVLGVFSLAMITAVSVDSVRNLPATALFGSSLIFFFVLAAVFFLLPSALVSSELASSRKDHAGVYTWVKDAFGSQSGFVAVWFQWIENVIWYPTILSFVAGTIGYLISPTLAANKTFLITIILCSFWGVTLINLMGLKFSVWFSNFCAIVGLMLPMLLIITLGAIWLFSHKPIQIHFTETAMLPHLKGTYMWVALTGIILSFCGMEIATVHAKDVRDPQRSYPKAMLIAAIIIVVTLVCGALSIAIVLPEKQISLVSGIMQAFHAFFYAYHLHWLLPIVAIMIAIGTMGGVNNWIIAPTRGLLVAAKDGHLPKHFQQENLFGAPSTLLVYQAVIVSMVTMVFLLMPSVNGSYWLLTALAAQLYMIMYVLMFAAAIRLRYKASDNGGGFRIPGGRKFGMWVVAGAGILGAVSTFIIGFIPPIHVKVGGELHYEMLLIIGLLIMSLPPFLIHRFKRRVS